MLHELKCHKTHFNSVWDGEKTAEFRLDDRNFKVGDTLLLRETTPLYYTGRCVEVSITHILKNFVGMENGYAMLSFFVSRRKNSCRRRRLERAD